MSRRSGTSDGRITADPIDPDVLSVLRDQPPAPTGASASAVIAGTFWNQATAHERADRIMAALAEAGYAIVNAQRAFDMAVALTDAHIDGDLEPCTCPDCLFALEFIADVQAHDAARQSEGHDGSR